VTRMSYILDALKRAEKKRLEKRDSSEPRAPEPPAMTDLQRLIEKYEQRMTELEAQIRTLKHKCDILLEASRLLEEEGFLDGQSLRIVRDS
jgi:hypothetical protein